MTPTSTRLNFLHLRSVVRCGSSARLQAYLHAGIRVYDERIVAQFVPEQKVDGRDMAKASRPKNPFAGRWRITWMEQWDQDFVDADVEGYLKFGPRNLGSFQFGYVQGEIDSRLTSREGQPCLEFTWEGNDEMNMACGRDWVVMDGVGLSGVIFLHQGGESALKATKSQST